MRATVASLLSIGLGIVFQTLVQPATVHAQRFSLLGLHEDLHVGGPLVRHTVAVVHALAIPVVLIGLAGLAINVFVSLRPWQPLRWHYAVVGELVFAAGVAAAGLFLVVLVLLNFAIGVAAGLAAIVAAVIVTGLVALLLSACVE